MGLLIKDRNQEQVTITSDYFYSGIGSQDLQNLVWYGSTSPPPLPPPRLAALHSLVLGRGHTWPSESILSLLPYSYRLLKVYFQCDL